jgi:alkyl hydroperoxide reductase subunit AhpF
MAENPGMFSTERTAERILVSDVFERKDQREPRPDYGFVQEASRQIPVYHRCDVLVVGGGPSGTAAAVAAAPKQAK